MSPTTTRDCDLRRRSRSPLGAALRGRARELLAICLLGTLSTYALLALLDVSAFEAAIPYAAAGDGGSTPAVAATTPTTHILFRAECALLVGVGVSLAAAVSYAGRDDGRVELSRYVGPLTLAAGLFVVGIAAGRLFVVPASLDLLLVGSDPGRRVVTDARWLAEFGLFVSVSVGLGAALPVLLVGAVRARLLPRYTSGRLRGLAALCLVAFASVYSPPDLPTFALVAAPPFAGFAAGIAWLEFR